MAHVGRDGTRVSSLIERVAIAFRCVPISEPATDTRCSVRFRSNSLYPSLPPPAFLSVR